MQLKVLSLNIHKGFAMFGRRDVMEELRDLIRSTHADVVLLQEIGLNKEHAPQAQNQWEYLADQVWHHYHYAQNAVSSRGHHGNAVLSRFPLKITENLNLSLHEWEKRGMLVVESHDPETGKQWVCATTHLNLLHRHRDQQVRDLSAFLAPRFPKTTPMILGGDFNDWQNQLSPKLFQELDLKDAYAELHGVPARTFPSFYPMLPLDRVYVRGFQIERAQVVRATQWLSGSDHLGLLVNLAF